MPLMQRLRLLLALPVIRLLFLLLLLKEPLTEGNEIKRFEIRL